MTRIINTSFSLGLFPRDLKNALVKPLLKKPSLDPNCLKNYRPVFNISFLSKVMEKIVSSQLIEHLAANDLLEPLQSAYRSGHSTETALLKVHDDIICAVGKKKAVLVVLLDLSAAFDTVEHSVLLDTLQSLGIDGSVLSWSESYLCDRSQQVTISGKKSEGRKLFCGVPQGLVLGPLLFTIYTSSLGKLLRDLDMPYHLYADDSQLYICFEPSSFYVRPTNFSNWFREILQQVARIYIAPLSVLLYDFNQRTCFETTVQLNMRLDTFCLTEVL